MISIIDLQGVEHKICPRCGGEWKYIGHKNNYVSCLGCEMIACRHSKENFFLSIEMGKYTLYWLSTYTMIEIADKVKSMNETDGPVKKSKAIHLPLLPLDISLDKLKIYLVFG